MNSAVTSSYGYYGPSQGSQGSQLAPTFAPAAARMSKRRRLDSPDQYASGHAWEQQQHQQQQQQQQQPFYGPPALTNAASFGSDHAGSEYATPANIGPHESATANAALNESSTGNTTAHWQHNTSSYPEVATYSQQPYFFGQTDPSTYNSPWPPANSTPAAFGTQTSSNYSIPASSDVMPYFPPAQRTAEANESTFDANTTTSVPNYQSSIESAQQYGYSQSGNGSQQHLQSRSEAPAPPSTMYFEDASMHLKVQSLSILENLAAQLIHTIAKASYPQVQEFMRGSDSEDGQAWTTLKNLFDQTRKVYSRETPFIDAIAIQMFQPPQQEVIRKANIATFISGILGAHDVSFFHLNEFFMETFVPLGHRLLKWQGAIYLELKTQTYISALMNSEGSPEAMLDELFPADLDAQILTRHPDAPSLSPSEQDFIDRCRARKNYLLAEDSTEEALRELPKKYQWQDFVREFASCISKNVDGIMNVPARSQPVFGSGGSGSSGDRRGTTAAANAALALSSTHSGARNAASGLPNIQAFLNDHNQSTSQSTSAHNNTTTTSDSSKSHNKQFSTTSHSTSTSASTSSTIRQPWTKPEEDALLSGLAKVNGPHWSQILALYGRGGSISEVLKDRNQVQLKDKARNLKLWYLKMGKEVPVALRGVTGELRKRGGARARAALGLGGAGGVGGVEDDLGEDGDVDGEGEALEMDGLEVGGASRQKGGTPVRRVRKKGP